VGDALVVTDADPFATNTVADQHRVVPVPLQKVELLGGELHPGASAAELGHRDSGPGLIT
jgi:hypothetical protein